MVLMMPWSKPTPGPKQRHPLDKTGPGFETVVNAIAPDTNTPAESVSKMYSEAWAEFREGGRITDYMTVPVACRARENLRMVCTDRH
jgi:hypothetical protein